MQRLLGAAVVALLPIAAQAQVAVTPDILVNTYTTGSQFGSTIATDAAGNFVIVWKSLDQDGSAGGTFARRFHASGEPVTSGEFRVNASTAGDQGYGAAAFDANGVMTVVWEGEDQGGGYDVFLRRYDADVPSAPVVVNEYTTSSQSKPAIANDDTGAFVVVWQAVLATGDGFEIAGRRHDATGTPLNATEFRVNTFTTGSQVFPKVARAPSGSFVVVWQSDEQDGDGDGIFGRRYTSTGAAGSAFQINSFTQGDQSDPSIGMTPDGGFLVTWTSFAQDGDGQGIYGRRYDADGVAQGSEFRVNSYTTSGQSLAAVAADGNGFVVAWASFRDGSNFGIYARAYDAAGVPDGNEFRVNAYTTGVQWMPSVAVQPGGRFVASWTGGGDVNLRRFTRDTIFADGFESVNLSRWSASATDGGDVAVTAGAALGSSTVGLRAVVDDTAGLFVEDRGPEDEDEYRARFYFDPNGFDPGESQAHRRTRLFIAFEEAPNRRLAAVVLRRLGGAYSIQGRTRLDDDSQYDTGFHAITNLPHFVEIHWKRATSPIAGDGRFELWIDGTSVHQATTLDNNLSAVDFVRMGALSVKTGATGILYFDEFVSHRRTYIGP